MMTMMEMVVLIIKIPTIRVMGLGANFFSSVLRASDGREIGELDGVGVERRSNFSASKDNHHCPSPSWSGC